MTRTMSKSTGSGQPGDLSEILRQQVVDCIGEARSQGFTSTVVFLLDLNDPDAQAMFERYCGVVEMSSPSGAGETIPSDDYIVCCLPCEFAPDLFPAKLRDEFAELLRSPLFDNQFYQVVAAEKKISLGISKTYFRQITREESLQLVSNCAD